MVRSSSFPTGGLFGTVVVLFGRLPAFPHYLPWGYEPVFLIAVLLGEAFPGQWFLFSRLVLRAVLVVEALLVETGRSYQLANRRWKE